MGRIATFKIPADFELKEAEERIQENQVQDFTFNLPFNSEQFRARQDISELKYWLYPLIPSGGHITVLCGMKGTGKTMFSLAIADAITKRNDFLSWVGRDRAEVVNNDIIPRVLFLDGEMSPQDMLIRLNQLDTNDHLYPYCYRDRANMDTFPPNLLADDSYRKFFTEKIIEKHIDVVMFDNIVSLFPGREENSAAEWSGVNQWLLDLRRNNIMSWVVAHMGKDKRAGVRGTSHIYDNVNDTIEMIDLRQDMAEDIFTQLSFKHFRSYVPHEERFDLLGSKKLKYTPNRDNDYEWKIADDNEERDKQKELVYFYLSQGYSQRRIVEEIGKDGITISQKTVSRMKKELEDEGRLSQGGDSNKSDSFFESR